MVLSSHIINFSASASREGLILRTSVTIGYHAPWRVVHQLLLDSACTCEGVLKDPKPFVPQTALDDCYAHYQINAFADHPSRMTQIYSDLHEKIQDKLNGAGVEITSSHYASVRDGNRSTIPNAYLPRGYKASPFHLGFENLFNARNAVQNGDKDLSSNAGDMKGVT